MTEEVEEKRGPGRPPKVQTVACMVLRDFWTAADENGGRVHAGSVIEVSPEEAMDGIEAGTLSRVK